MQLAKNLYLGREKVLARKGREALLTMVLEQAFDKRKLLELYMNVVELGPGVYGVKSAASYYFNTTPDRLTIAQCFFLASILPSPKKQHFESDGRISKARRAYLEKLMRIAHDRDRLSSTELERALAEELVLGRPDTGGFLAAPGATESSPEEAL
jgi:membrane peptidoglycan carboxypeptidase